MTPNKGMPPLRLALAVLFDHPELLTLDPVRARAVQELIVSKQQNPTFGNVWQFISAHPLGGDDPWAALVPITLANGQPATGQDGATLYQWVLSPEMCAIIQQPLATALRLARAARPVTAAQPAAATIAGADWTLTQLASRYGLALPSLGFDPGTNTGTVQLQNSYLRHLAVYVEFFADGQPVQPTTWTSRLPAAVQDFLESATVKYLGMLPPRSPVTGMAIPSGATSLSFTLPDPATGARLLFGGPGLGNLQLLADAAATLLTAVLDYAVPAILDGAGTGTGKGDWYAGILADKTILNEVLAAGRFLFTGPSPADSPALLQTLSANLGALLLGDALPTLQASIARNIGAQAIANAAPVLGWAAAELAAQAGQPLRAQTASETLSSPATFSLDLAPLAITLTPDPRHGSWPDLAATYQVVIAHDDTSLVTVTGAVPQEANAPITLTIPGLPAGGRAAISASLQSAGGWICGRAQAPAALVPTVDRAPLALGLSLSERLAPLDASTQYLHKRKLVYDPDTRTHRWQDGAAPSAVGLVPATGAAFRALVGITLQEETGDIGYTWQEGSAEAQYAFQNVGVLDPEARLKYSGLAFSIQPYLAYDRMGDVATAEAGTGRNDYLDPRTYAADGLYHLRGVALDAQTPFDLDQTTSWGAFYDPPSRIIFHPAGLAVACFQGQDSVQTLALPVAAVPLAQAPVATLILGPGTGVGAVTSPVAAAVTSAGYLVALEQGNVRLQACDVFGNPVQCFAGPSAVAPLQPENGPVQYLDLAVGPNDVLFVLSSQGSAPQAGDYRLDLYRADGAFLSRTTGVAAARLVADNWGRIYTLNFAQLAGPGGRFEPSISQWIPSGT